MRRRSTKSQPLPRLGCDVMQDWLVICLRAPLASFGGNAGNAERDTSDLPTRSALIGLAAAALGIEREDGEGQAQLARGLVTAAALYDRGHPLTDFHTFQSLHQAARGAATRAEALGKTAHLETSISRRHYRADGLWQGAYCLSGLSEGQMTLEILKEAFEAPHFTLYLGRKSCPLSHPLAPRIRANLKLDAVIDAITGLKVAEDDREGVRGNIGHIEKFDHRTAKDGFGLACLIGRLPQIIAVAVLQSADDGERGAVHGPRSAIAVNARQRIHKLDKRVGVQVGGMAVQAVGDAGFGHEALRLKGGAAVDECEAFLRAKVFGQREADFLFDVMAGIFNEPIANIDVRRHFLDGKFHLVERRFGCLRRNCFALPLCVRDRQALW
ncbi:type I-E CRISPR-associated protein Cas5/CasD [Agrobacterium vitis]|nr:type I-E CRISPR-associated protein Cas5/CasD [Agrobacterium vitis]